MKKFTTFIALLVVCCTVGCTVGIGMQTCLTIQNKSTVDITLLNWGAYSFDGKSLMSGSEYSIEITSGSNYIYFTKKDPVSNTDIIYFTEYYTCRDNETSTFTFTDYTSVTQKDDTANKGILKDIQPRYSQLTIQNNSSYDLLNVTWIDTVFSSNPLEDILEADTFVVKYVSDGYGYVYFTIKNSDFMAKTKAVVSVPKRESVVFEITDETIVREKYNEENIGTVSTAEKRVVFYDDAEGEYQQYTQREADYSKEKVYKGDYSISVDGEADHLTISVYLTKSAILSFWYDNDNAYYRHDSQRDSYIGKLKINSNIYCYFDDTNWSYIEIPLSSGSNVIDFISGSYYSGYSHLYLDNIKIAYTE